MSEGQQLTETRPTFIEQPDYDLKLFLNGFPKSGLHLLLLMVRPLLQPMQKKDSPMFQEPNWVGTFHDNSWSTRWVEDMRRITFKLGRVPAGYCIKGHAGHCAALENFLWYLGMGHIFIYRDLRDVAVSTAYHIMNADNEKLSHPNPQVFLDLGGFDEILEAVIVGHDIFACVLHRWEYYSPWLDVPWTLSVRYEDLMRYPEEMAELILRYTFCYTPNIYGFKVEIDESDWLPSVVEEMVKTSRLTDWSPTFREGVIGSWQTHFTERHKRLFKESDKFGWLCRLGYAETEDW